MNEPSDDYRVLFSPSLEIMARDVFAVTAESEDESRKIIEVLASYTLFLYEHRAMKDRSNYGIVERFADGEWAEIQKD